MASIRLNNVIKRFGSNVTLHNVNLDVEDGEFTVFVGPSGCGKSTLLRMIAGLEEISDGHIAIDEQVVNDVAPAHRGVAMVFQSYALYPPHDGGRKYGLWPAGQWCGERGDCTSGQHGGQNTATFPLARP